MSRFTLVCPLNAFNTVIKHFHPIWTGSLGHRAEPLWCRGVRVRTIMFMVHETSGLTPLDLCSNLLHLKPLTLTRSSQPAGQGLSWCHCSVAGQGGGRPAATTCQTSESWEFWGQRSASFKHVTVASTLRAHNAAAGGWRGQLLVSRAGGGWGFRQFLSVYGLNRPVVCWNCCQILCMFSGVQRRRTSACIIRNIYAPTTVLGGYPL